jgi:hypothetical protein
MAGVNDTVYVWKTYLDELRNEVVLGSGVFGEDEQLRVLLHECFTDGDPLNGIVSWNHAETQLN